MRLTHKTDVTDPLAELGQLLHWMIQIPLPAVYCGSIRLLYIDRAAFHPPDPERSCQAQETTNNGNPQESESEDPGESDVSEVLCSQLH